MENPKEFTIGKIFTDSSYLIPLYQRNYAWEQGQTTQLIRDIWDFSGKQQNYYIGTLVVHPKDDGKEIIYETIDGQQRLTTLNILLSVLKHEFGINYDKHYAAKLQFSSRLLSSETLSIFAVSGAKVGERKVNSKMLQAYYDMSRELKQLSGGKAKLLKTFSDYLFKYVILVRVAVPRDTDLNHYFEVMNNRGEQLEKHEILKAHFLELLKLRKDSSRAFALIWEACSAMDRYMLLGFRRSLRDRLFLSDDQTWDDFPANFMAVRDAVKEDFSAEKPQGKISTSVLHIINNPKVKGSEDPLETEPVTRFTTIVTFPNFLLQVLRATTGKNIPLDDKQLLIEFAKAIKAADNKEKFAREFAWKLLRLRFMLDKYVIKRELTDKTEGWSLKMMQPVKSGSFQYANTFGTNEAQSRVIMLVSMFHVSFVQPIYKHWLSGLLFYFHQHEIKLDGRDYINYLENLSDAFYFDRFGPREYDFYNIIYKHGGKPKQNEILPAKLNDGTNVQNFIFNRLDYLLWRSVSVLKEKRFSIDHIDAFEFSFRSSVEHFYPQHPMEGLKPMRQTILNSFGNLCLISTRKNSKLSNYPPIAKAVQHKGITAPESLKQQIMMNLAAEWDKDMIAEHQEDMVDVLQNGY